MSGICFVCSRSANRISDLSELSRRCNTAAAVRNARRIADSTAGKLLRGDHIERFVIMGTYYIPKKYVIDYVLGDHYAHYKNMLKAKLPTKPLKGGGKK